MTFFTYSLKKKPRISIATDLQEGLAPAVMSRDEIKQTIINLIKNSIQAIVEHGTILIRTRQISCDCSIQVMIEDSGAGIREDLIPRIFDPFYTTKQNGEGTGLGLSVVYGMMKKYNGTIHVSSKEGQGTRIYLTIPAE